MACGVPVKIFNIRDVYEMIKFAADSRLHLTSVGNFNCEARVVHWLGLDYTFANLLFVKK